VVAKKSQIADQREQATDEQLAAQDPEKVYEENLKAYKQANPDEGLVEKAVEGTKGLVERSLALKRAEGAEGAEGAEREQELTRTLKKALSLDMELLKEDLEGS